MNVKLKNKDGKVTFLLRTGKHLVRNAMAVASAQHIINTGTLKDSDVEGYAINVDDKWYFEGEPVSGKQRKAEIEAETEPTAPAEGEEDK